ncbi:MAG: class I SAM-dependent methyltransferase [Spirochaetota bacterium]
MGFKDFFSIRRFRTKSGNWNAEYREGQWDYLDKEGMRYRALAGTIASLGNDTDILDVGCGPGILLNYLSAYRSYLGMDISREAIRRAPKREQASFAVASVEAFTTDRKFSVIIFNELLYYCDYRSIIPRFAAFLAPGGAVISSVFVSYPQKPETVEGIECSLNEQFSPVRRSMMKESEKKEWLMLVHRSLTA